ncbi:hypothetical protein JCM10207_003052 [Rhodosporidiobolus poonsookiae]
MLRLAIPEARQLLKLTPTAPLTFSRSATRLTRHRRRPTASSSTTPQPLAQTPRNAAQEHGNHLQHVGQPGTSPSIEVASPVAAIPVNVPRDEHGVVDSATAPWSHKLRDVLSQPAIVVTRQLEAMNIFLGWEEANKYALMSPEGHTLAYLLEEETGMAGVMSRQLLRTHRPFRATVIDTEGQVLLRVYRPFALINSRIYVSTPSAASSAGEAKEEMKLLEAQSSSSPSPSTALATQQSPPAVPDDAGDIIGEVQQEWHVYRRRYNAFVRRADGFEQFARFDSGFLAWDFEAKDEEGRVIGSVNRNFTGFGRELFTDTGQYVLNFEAASVPASLPAPSSSEALPSPTSSSSALTPSSPSSHTPSSFWPTEAPTAPSLPLDHRAVLLASAITVDIDYFSRTRGGLLGGGMGGFMPVPIPMGGVGGGGAAGEAGEVGGAASDGPLPSTRTEPEDDLRNGSLRPNSEEGVPRGEDGVVPGGGAGQGWGDGGGDEVMRDPWADEGAREEGGTWGWNDLFGDDEGGGGGGDWGGDGDGW